ncbi:hypothetical protein BDZ90DRAFT_233127 [Jaminaea rosea]|uniref:Uncharacterized protein n=1 Tax=Jaminaea rosea TaxID=1569628 RepID=A0A316UTT3_9BASI|nr:hypothetical protein BDZ90DRAFT_233127 [Jaminaea rosea]PWN26495.1 hypothetical protein BDZ90DRAFT_233127 [Jaminaea rosea]
MSEQPHDTTAKGSGALAGVSAAVSGAGKAVANSATSAYNNAPDLGVTSTLQSAYDKAPDMGLSQQAQKLSSGAGGQDDGANGQAEASGGNAGQAGESAPHHDDNAEYGVSLCWAGSVSVPTRLPSESSSSSLSFAQAQRLSREHEERIAESKRQGPSTDKRLNKSQTDIGIEDKVPTAAGYGSTLPPDKTVLDSAGKSVDSKPAKVPEDYEPVDCPSQYVDGHEKRGAIQNSAHGNDRNGHAATQGGRDDDEGAEAGESKSRGLGKKVKDQIKGDAKVVSGVVRRDDDKVAAGKAIKRGEA